ncbi:IS6 family transposase [Methylovirgula sp. 4M-Z18]|uniref:DDE-type integrase/transposase/recombinase n=1 Tax=Methylovirgula sp. 4M-Z18 TaxID=2293567 RepID=UPI000E2EA23C|nr:DDE-type integrase/transposase/recombinase [Methylovirgula sp. 4M-Z18]RFB76715.1 IS6 family transposase [Methylovirgula sp. 4M-Z18]
MDAVVIHINGEACWPWRAMDADGDVLDILVQKRRNAKAARCFFRRLVQQYAWARVLVTDKLCSYGVAARTVTPESEHLCITSETAFRFRCISSEIRKPVDRPPTPTVALLVRAGDIRLFRNGATSKLRLKARSGLI